MLKSKTPTKVANKKLGHFSTSITLDTYFHILESIQEKATDKINNIIEKMKGKVKVARNYKTLRLSNRCMLVINLFTEKIKMVGMTGLEPATPSPPDLCATKLRHIPTSITTTIVYTIFKENANFIF